MYQKHILLEKLREAAASVLPITGIVAAMCFVLVPMDTGLMLSFLLGSIMLILGMGLFTLGAEMSMSHRQAYRRKNDKLPETLAHSGAELRFGSGHHYGGAGPAGAGHLCAGY